MNLPKACLLTLLIPMFLALPAKAAMITWDAAPSQVILADVSQVSTAGTLVAAVTANPSGASVNGVSFVNFTSASQFTRGAGWLQGGQSNSAPGAYGDLLNWEEYNNTFSNSFPAVFSGLTPGQQYQLEIWMPYHYDLFPTLYGSASNGSNNSPALNAGTSTPPQYIFGTFTADGTGTQNLYQFGTPAGSNFALMGALQLRAVPEPQTWALAALGASAVLFRLRRKQRSN